MGLRGLIIHRRKILLGVLAVALVAWGGYYLWVTRGAGQAAGIYITGDGGGYVVIERSWIPGQLRVREGLINHVRDRGEHWEHPGIDVAVRNDRMTLRQEWSYGGNDWMANVAGSLQLVPSGIERRDWALIGGEQIHTYYETSDGERYSMSDWQFWRLIFSSLSWDEFREVKTLFDDENDSIEVYSIKPSHEPMLFFLHRIDDPRLVEYMRGRLEKPSTPEDLALIRQMAADHPGDPWLDLHLVELELAHGDLDTAAGLLGHWRAAHGGVGDALLQSAAAAVDKGVLTGLVLRANPGLWGIKEIFSTLAESYSLEKETGKPLEELLEWFVALERAKGILFYPKPLVSPKESSDVTGIWLLFGCKVAQVMAMLDLVAGRRQHGLDMLCGIYRFGQGMDVDGESIRDGTGYYFSKIGLYGLQVYALNACETATEIRSFRKRMALLGQVSHQETSKSILKAEFFWDDQIDAMTPTQVGDAHWRNLLMSAAAWESLLTTGEFPRSEADFAALFDDGLPLDPFGANLSPIRFISSADECIVYSVGPDRIDDHAQIIYNPDRGGRSRGDILMRVPREQEYPFLREGVRAANAAELQRQFPHGLPLDPFIYQKLRPLSILDSDAGHPVRIFSFGPDFLGSEQDHYLGLGGWTENGVGEAVFYRDKFARAGIHIDPAYDPTNGITSNGDLFMDLPR